MSSHRGLGQGERRCRAKWLLGGLVGWLLLGAVACGAGTGRSSSGISPEMCRRMVERRVGCGQTPPSLAATEVDRCQRQGDCWARIVQRPLIPRLWQCMSTAPCNVDCPGVVMADAPMSPAAAELERVCLAKGCGSRCEIARDLAGASDEILTDLAWCFQHHPCGEVRGCAVGAVLAKAIECVGTAS